MVDKNIAVPAQAEPYKNWRLESVIERLLPAGLRAPASQAYSPSALRQEPRGVAAVRAYPVQPGRVILIVRMTPVG
jgi:hypothetical protein